MNETSATQTRVLEGEILADTNATVLIQGDDKFTTVCDELASNNTIEKAVADQPCSMPDFDKLYRFTENTKSGGYGIISKATDTVFGRIVATKQLHKRFEENPRAVLRFINECKLNSRLDHPSIVPVYGLGKDHDGHWHAAMKYINGISLRKYLAIQRRSYAKKGFDPEIERNFLLNRLEIFLKLCDVVKYCHNEKVVHGDIKPENIMIGRHGELYLMDWGCARKEGTTVNSTFGTPAYLPPESADERTVRCATDIYALGIVLKELVSMREPQSHDTMEWYYSSFKPVMFLSGGNLKHFDSRFSIDRRLKAIVTKATQIAPEQRYETAEALQEDVRSFLYDRAVEAMPDSLLGKLSRLLNRNRSISAAIFFVALIALLAGGIFGMMRNNEIIARNNAKRMQMLMMTQETGSLATVSELQMLSLCSRLELLSTMFGEACADKTTFASPVETVFDNAAFLNPQAAPDDMAYHEDLLGNNSLTHPVRLTKGGSPEKYPGPAEVVRIGRRAFAPLLQNNFSALPQTGTTRSPVVGVKVTFADGTSYRYPGCYLPPRDKPDAKWSILVGGSEIFWFAPEKRDNTFITHRSMAFTDRSGNPIGTIGIDIRLDTTLSALLEYSRLNPDQELLITGDNRRFLRIKNGGMATEETKRSPGLTGAELRELTAKMKKDEMDFIHIVRNGGNYILCRTPLRFVKDGALINIIPYETLKKKAENAERQKDL